MCSEESLRVDTIPSEPRGVGEGREALEELVQQQVRWDVPVASGPQPGTDAVVVVSHRPYFPPTIGLILGLLLGVEG